MRGGMAAQVEMVRVQQVLAPRPEKDLRGRLVQVAASCSLEHTLAAISVLE